MDNAESAKLNQIIFETEVALFGKPLFKKDYYAMWLDLDDFTSASPSLSLLPVKEESQWQSLEKLRAEIEVPFGIIDSTEIKRMIQENRRVTKELNATWYLAKANSEYVGEIALGSRTLTSPRDSKSTD